MSAKLVSLTINTAYLAQQMDFYKVLGFKFERVSISKGGEVFRAKHPQFEINLFGMQDKKNSGIPSLQFCFQVEQLETVFQDLCNIRGVTTLLEPTDMPDGRKASLKDPDGNSVEVIQGN